MAQWLYKREEEPKIFDAELVPQALADGWTDSPAKIKRKLIDLTKTELQSLCDSKGISYVHNTGKEKLIEKLREG